MGWSFSNAEPSSGWCGASYGDLTTLRHLSDCINIWGPPENSLSHESVPKSCFEKLHLLAGYIIPEYSQDICIKNTLSQSQSLATISELITKGTLYYFYRLQIGSESHFFVSNLKESYPEHSSKNSWITSVMAALYIQKFKYLWNKAR